MDPIFAIKRIYGNYLKKKLKKLEYRYILEIKDCFSKWLWCYPLKDKTGETVL